MSAAPTRTVSLTANEKGASVSKFLICLHEANGNPERAAAIAAERCRQVPVVEHALRHMVTKAAVGASTVSATDPYTIGAEVFALLQSASIFGRLMPLFRRVPFRTRVSREIGAGSSGAWRGEGLAAPVTRTTFDTLQFDVFVSDYIVLVTRELFKFGAVAETALRTSVIAGLARWLDSQMLDPAVASSAFHPSSLTHGTEVLTSAGATAANILTDLSALIGAIQSPAGNTLRWVMRPLTFFQIAAKLAGVGLNVTPDNLLGIPAVLGSTSPHQIALIDAASVAYTSDDAMAIDVTSWADVQMDGAPTGSGVSGTGSSIVSLFQSGLVAVRAEFAMNWEHIDYGNASPTVPSGAAVMAVSYSYPCLRRNLLPTSPRCSTRRAPNSRWPTTCRPAAGSGDERGEGARARHPRARGSEMTSMISKRSRR